MDLNQLFKILKDREKNYIQEEENIKKLYKYLIQNKNTKFRIKKFSRDSFYFKIKNKIKNLVIFITINISGLFDKKWYLEEYRDVKITGLDPIIHFIVAGVYEGKNPNKFFDCSFYLFKNPSCLKKNINPLFHFIMNNFYKKNLRKEQNQIENFTHPYLQNIEGIIKDILKKEN